MSDKQARVRAVIDAVTALLASDGAAAVPAAAQTIARVDSTDLHPDAFADLPPRIPCHEAVLDTAIGTISTPALQPLRQCLIAAKDDLRWQQDDMKYYPPESDLGAGYIQTNLHTLLIGPGACGFHHDDFTLGLFMLGPRTLYRDHQHDAPETYINLSPRTGWRFDDGDWQDHGAGSIIFNPPNAVHATRSYETPFLSVFSWLNDIQGQCAVTPRDDWAEIEAQLKTA